MMLAVALIALQLPFAPPTTAVQIENGEKRGYIEAVVNGKVLTRTFERLVPTSNGRVERKKVTTVWQAGPGQSLTIKRQNWSTSTGQLSVILRYYDDGGTLVGVSAPRQFAVRTAGTSTDRWTFTVGDLQR